MAGGGPVTRYSDFFAPLGEFTIAFSIMEEALNNAIRMVEGLPVLQAKKTG
jgi:hypothetical protein